MRYIALVWFALVCWNAVLAVMDSLSSLGVSCELTQQEFTRDLLRASDAEGLIHLRESLFRSAVDSGLADVGDALVTRRKTGGGRPLKVKHAEDVWMLARSLQQDAPLPRILLRNGKRSRCELLRSQARLKGTYLPSEHGALSSVDRMSPRLGGSVADNISDAGEMGGHADDVDDVSTAETSVFVAGVLGHNVAVNRDTGNRVEQVWFMAMHTLWVLELRCQLGKVTWLGLKKQPSDL